MDTIYSSRNFIYVLIVGIAIILIFLVVGAFLSYNNNNLENINNNLREETITDFRDDTPSSATSSNKSVIDKIVPTNSLPTAEETLTKKNSLSVREVSQEPGLSGSNGIASQLLEIPLPLDNSLGIDSKLEDSPEDFSVDYNSGKDPIIALLEAATKSSTCGTPGECSIDSTFGISNDDCELSSSDFSGPIYRKSRTTIETYTLL